MPDKESNQVENISAEIAKARQESFDAVRRHICQVLNFDCGFIDRVNNHEITTAVTFSADDSEDVNKLLDGLVDEHKQSVTVANTLLAQKVLQTRSPLVSRLYSPEEVKASEESSDNPGVDAEGIPYIIVPIFDNPGEGGIVRGLIRVMSFDASREMDSQDLSTLKLMGDHLSTRVGIFGDISDSVAHEPTEAERFEFDSILIVHSDRLARRRFSRILRQNFNILEADTSERALEILEDETRVDLILLDAGLKGTSGLGFCKVIKDSEKWHHIPVVLVNADNTPAARVEGLNVGADDCIPDSCLEAELVARVNSSLRHLRTERDLSVQLNLLEDYAQRLEKAQEELKNEKQTQDQSYLKLQQMKQEADVLRNQDNLLHRISNMIRSSFDISGNLAEMLEALAGWWTLDSCFIVMPSEEEPEDTVRVEYCSDKSYRVVDFDKDLETLRIFRENFDADEAVISNDALNDRRLVPFRKSALSGFQVKSLFYIPINYEQKLLGLLVGYKCEMKANWSRINETFMSSVSDQVANGVVNARLYAKVQRQATTDGLTGLFNHRTGQEKLAEQLKLAERYQRNISVIMLDVDHFKSINDNYGHPAGDSVLKAVSRLIKKNCRDVDIPVRYGGEEFLIVLPEISQDGAVVVAERIRSALENEIVNHEDIEISVTGSFGVASFPVDAESQQHLLDLADKSLYYSKRVSRNRVSTVNDLSFDTEAKDDLAASSEEIAKTLAEHEDFSAPEISEEARQTEELVPEVVEMVKSLAASLYAKSDYNKQHHLEVARMSELLAKVMGLSAQQVEQIRVAGLLHDVGLLKLPKTVIDKEGSLSSEERDIVNQHPILGAQLLKPVRALRDICEILEHHHERWDGTGFPSGMKGEEIPLPARIVAIVDSYHAMISERPYREAMSHEEALQSLQNGAGRQWDPFLVEIFSAVIKSMKEGGSQLPAAAVAAAKQAKASIEEQETETQEPEVKSENAAAPESPTASSDPKTSQERAAVRPPLPPGVSAGMSTQPGSPSGQPPQPPQPPAQPPQPPAQPTQQPMQPQQPPQPPAQPPQPPAQPTQQPMQPQQPQQPPQQPAQPPQPAAQPPQQPMQPPQPPQQPAQASQQPAQPTQQPMQPPQPPAQPTQQPMQPPQPPAQPLQQPIQPPQQPMQAPQQPIQPPQPPQQPPAQPPQQPMQPPQPQIQPVQRPAQPQQNLPVQPFPQHTQEMSRPAQSGNVSDASGAESRIAPEIRNPYDDEGEEEDVEF